MFRYSCNFGVCSSPSWYSCRIFGLPKPRTASRRDLIEDLIEAFVNGRPKKTALESKVQRAAGARRSSDVPFGTPPVAAPPAST